MRIIVNADDFGPGDSVNESVALSAVRGMITSATMMVKRPGFEGAAEISRRLQGRISVGIHRDLDERFLFDEDGRSGMNEGAVIGTYREIIEEKRVVLEKVKILSGPCTRGFFPGGEDIFQRVGRR